MRIFGNSRRVPSTKIPEVPVFATTRPRSIIVAEVTITPPYTARVTATGARNGRVVSDDAVLDHMLKTPGS